MVPRPDAGFAPCRTDDSEGVHVPHATSAAPGVGRSVFRTNQWMLSLSQVFSGLGIAIGFAVGGLLAEDLTGRASFAGIAQTASILGAGLVALPLARLAGRRSRRVALSVGFGIAVLGAVIILIGARTSSPVLFFLGMLLFGSATATRLQARYAATDSAPVHLRGRALSVVVWAATVGSVAGPNLADPGASVGRMLGLSEHAGPFVLSVAAYLLAIVFTVRLRSPGTAPTPDGEPAAAPDAAPTVPTAARSGAESHTAPSTGSSSLRDGVRVITSHPRAMLGFAAVVLGHTVMVSVMVMTPVHMEHAGDTIAVIGIVISLHILGMYALSPLVGLMADRIGAVPVIWLGFGLFAASAVVGITDDLVGSSTGRISTALILLGLGWSSCFIAGSTLLTESVPESSRVTVQGVSDAGMNLGAAVFAAVAGPLLALGGFTLINVVAMGIVILGAVTAVYAHRASRHPAGAGAISSRDA